MKVLKTFNFIHTGVEFKVGLFIHDKKFNAVTECTLCKLKLTANDAKSLILSQRAIKYGIKKHCKRREHQNNLVKNATKPVIIGNGDFGVKYIRLTDGKLVIMWCNSVTGQTREFQRSTKNPNHIKVTKIPRQGTKFDH